MSSLKDLSNRLSKMAAENIYYLRKYRKLRQLDLASKVSLSHRHVQKIEAGTIDLKASTIESFAKALDVPACYLINDVGGLNLQEYGFLCPQEILAHLDIGIQFNRVDGLVTYLNSWYRHGTKADKNRGERKYIWDYLADASEAAKLKEYLNYLVTFRPPQSPYFNQIKAKDGTKIPIRVDWKYIFDDKENLIGFLSVITKHPSW